MLQVDHLWDIHELHRQGQSIRAIAELTGLSRNTIRKVLRGQHNLVRKSAPKVSCLDPHKDYLQQRFTETRLSAVRLLAEIRPMGYEGSLVTLRRFLQPLKQQTQATKKLTVRFETPPGQQAQADWASCGHLLSDDEANPAVSVFVMVLGYSRMVFVHFTTSMKMGELLRCHQEAFRFFGGWPREILYDNMKQVKLSRSQWNEQLLDFAGHYGFTPKTHRVRRPRTKGKVERFVEYVQDNFLAGRSFADLVDLNAQGLHWLEQTANVRVHATTGQRPCDLFAQEQLTPYASIAPYRYLDPVGRTVNWESMVHFRGSRYSVPPAYAGQKVQVAAAGGQIVIQAGEAIIAEHRQAAQSGQCIVDKSHLEELWKVTCRQVPSPEVRPPFDAATLAVQTTALRVYEEVSL